MAQAAQNNAGWKLLACTVFPSLCSDYADHCENVDQPTQAIECTFPGKEPLNVSLFDAHNWSLYYMEMLHKKGNVLIYVDSHRDLSSGTLKPVPRQVEDKDLAHFAEHAGYAYYVSAAIAHGIVAEMYWVIPWWRPRIKDCAREPEMDYCLAKLERLGICSGTDNPLDTDLYLTYGPCESGHFKDTLTTIDMHALYADQLPDMSAEKDVILDIDMDWVGLDSGRVKREIHTPHSHFFERLNTLLFLTTLKKKRVHPSLVTIAMSKGYSYMDLVEDSARYMLAALHEYSQDL